MFPPDPRGLSPYWGPKSSSVFPVKADSVAVGIDEKVPAKAIKREHSRHGVIRYKLKGKKKGRNLNSRHGVIFT
jgi:hypothetical protein